MIKFLASKKLTAYLLLFFLTILLARTLTESEDIIPLLGSLALLFLNLLCSLCKNFPSLQRKPGLFLFHIGLLVLILFVGWGQLYFFKGYFELSEQGRFDGEYLTSNRGPFFNPEQIQISVDRGSIVSQTSHTRDRNVYGSFINIKQNSVQGESIWLESGSPAPYGNFSFYLQNLKHGLTLFFKFKEHRGSEKFFGLNMPLQMPRTNEFSLPGSQETYKATLLLENYEFKRPDGNIPENIKVALHDKEKAIIILQVGEPKRFKNGTLELLDLKLWDGILLTYDPTAIYLGILVLFCSVAIFWHYVHVAIGGNFPNRVNRFFSRLDVLLPLILTLITFATYWRVSTFGFVWDDSGDILKNQHYTPLSFDSMLQFWKEPFQNLYIPVPYTVWGAITFLSRFLSLTTQNNGMDPGIFHGVNLFFHILNVLLVFNILKVVLKRWVPLNSSSQTKKPLATAWAAGYGAMLFALHPVQIEPVSWINGLRGILCAFFSLLFIRYWLRNTIWGDQKKEAPSFLALHFVMASGLLCLALLSKPSGVVTPIIAFILGVSVMKYPVKRSLLVFLPWGALTVLFVFVTQMAQPEAIMKVITPVWARPLIAGDALLFYLLKIAYPVTFAVDYGRSPEIVLQAPSIYYSWLVPLILFLLFRFLKRLRPLLIPLGIFVIALLPFLGLLPFTTQAISTVADRYLYMAMLGPALGFAWCLSKVSMQKPLVLVCSSLLLFGAGVQSALQKWHWKDEFTLFSHAVEVNPTSYIAHHFVGSHLIKQGKVRKADLHFASMRRIRPSYEKSPHGGANKSRNGIPATQKPQVPLNKNLAIEYNNLGNKFMEANRFAEAVEKYEKALQIDPQMVQTYNNLSVVLHALKKDKEALQRLKEALNINPYFIEAYINLAIILGDIGRHDQAIEVLQGALELAPDDAEVHNNLGIIFVEKEEIEKGLEQFQEALRIDPEYKDVYHNIEYAESFRKK